MHAAQPTVDFMERSMPPTGSSSGSERVNVTKGAVVATICTAVLPNKLHLHRPNGVVRRIFASKNTTLSVDARAFFSRFMFLAADRTCNNREKHTGHG